MEVSKISIFNNNVPKTKKQQVLEGAAILGGSTALGIGTYGVIDYFTEKKAYNKILKQEKADFYQRASDHFNADVAELEKMGKVVDAKKKAAVWRFNKEFEKVEYNNRIELLNKLRNSRLKKHLGISAGIGLSIGTAALAVKSIFENKNVQNSQVPVKPVSFVQFTGNKIPFTGIIDKISDELTTEQREEFQKVINGEEASSTELENARTIGRLRINRDWPQGLNEHNKWLYGINDGNPIREKPKTDKEYQMLLLKQMIELPEEPPRYYRNYDKWFNTERWQKYQKWPDYITACLTFERTETLINRARLESYAEEKAAAELATKKELTAACIKYKINQDFLLDFNSNNQKVKIPNAIMIFGKNKAETVETIKWIVAKANSNYTFIEDKGDSNQIRLDQIKTVLETAQENYKKNRKRTLIWVENFDKLLSNSEENEDIVADFKKLLDKLSKEYKTTIVFNCQNTKKLNPITIQPHRVKKYDIDREVSTEEFQKLHDSLVLASIHQIKHSDGYRYKYVPFDNNQHVDLYLGDFGYTSSVLWVDSQKSDAINAVIKNFNVIKTIPQFKNIKSLKFPKPDNIKELTCSNLRCTGNITKDGKVIYEYKL